MVSSLRDSSSVTYSQRHAAAPLLPVALPERVQQLLQHLPGELWFFPHGLPQLPGTSARSETKIRASLLGPLLPPQGEAGKGAGKGLSKETLGGREAEAGEFLPQALHLFPSLSSRPLGSWAWASSLRRPGQPCAQQGAGSIPVSGQALPALCPGRRGEGKSGTEVVTASPYLSHGSAWATQAGTTSRGWARASRAMVPSAAPLALGSPTSRSQLKIFPTTYPIWREPHS